MTQRGNRREQVFFSNGDHLAYVSWLREYAAKHHVGLLAYCLMSNHVHLIVVPGNRNSLQLLMRPLHARYAQRVNRAMCRKGHVWQGRYFSSALDETHFWSAIRYVERNPVRAGIVARAEDYAWSSARAHCGLGLDPALANEHVWRDQFRGVGNWSAWLAEGDKTEHLAMLRQCTEKGLPCGSEQFVEALQEVAGRPLTFKTPGRPRAAE